VIFINIPLRKKKKKTSPNLLSEVHLSSVGSRDDIEESPTATVQIHQSLLRFIPITDGLCGP
jgi:hypothetical protein